MAWFGLSRWNIERAARPWGERPSILRFLESAPQIDPTRNAPPELPDDDIVSTGGIRWAAGALDGVGIFHMGRGEPEAAAEAVWSAVVDVVADASDANVKLLRDTAMKERAFHHDSYGVGVTALVFDAAYISTYANVMRAAVPLIPR